MQAFYSTGENDARGDLISLFTPDLYAGNPFRLLELPAVSNMRDVDRRMREIQVAQRTGVELPPGAGRALPLPVHADLFPYSEAAESLREPARRFLSWLFWFWPLTPDNDEALGALCESDFEHATDLWQEAASENDSVRRVIGRHNLAVFAHAMALDIERRLEETPSQAALRSLSIYWNRSYKRWTELAADETFWVLLNQRVVDEQDPRLTVSIVDELRSQLPLGLMLINANFAAQLADREDGLDDAMRHLEIVRSSGFDHSIQMEALTAAISGMRERVRTFLQVTRERIDENPLHGLQLGEKLVDQCAPLLRVVDVFLPEDEPEREALHDQVVDTIRTCMLAYARRTEDWLGVKGLAERARGIAAGDTMKERLDADLRDLDNNAQSGNDWYSPGYWELPQPVLDRMEEAHTMMEQRNWFAIIALLESVLLMPELQPAQREIVNRSLATSINMNVADRLNNLMDSVVGEPPLIRRMRESGMVGSARFRLTQQAMAGGDINGAMARGQLYCMVCGEKPRDPYTITHDGMDILVCENCHEEDRQFKADAHQQMLALLPVCWADLQRAKALDANNPGIDSNIEGVRDLADNLEVNLNAPVRQSPLVSQSVASTSQTSPAFEPSYETGPTPGSSSAGTVVKAAKKTSRPGDPAKAGAHIGAGIVDLIVGGGVGFLLGPVLARMFGQIDYWFFFVLCLYLVQMAQYVLFRRTLGEVIAKVRVVDYRMLNHMSFLQAVWRPLVFFGPMAFHWLGIFLPVLSLVTKDNRGLHDYLSGTLLVYN